jgi:hypothetical protein
MSSDRLTLLLVVVAAVALAGCAGADGGNGGTGAGTTVADGGADDAGGSSDWCEAGQSMQMTNPQTGERASWEVRGIVQEGGRQVCRVTWESNQGDVQQVELFFTENESYRKMVTYDANGNVVNEVQLTGGDGADGSAGSAGSGSSGDGGSTAASWCGEMGSMQFVDPQTGERASFETQGIVDREGRQVCKAVWETNQGEIRRVEMYFNEDESYQKLIYYDADGTVVNEIEAGSG